MDKRLEGKRKDTPQRAKSSQIRRDKQRAIKRSWWPPKSPPPTSPTSAEAHAGHDVTCTWNRSLRPGSPLSHTRTCAVPGRRGTDDHFRACAGQEDVQDVDG